VPQPLKDAREPALISGVPWVRQSSPDGRYLFTLYIQQSGAAMVHQLDVRAGVARCIDLPGEGDFAAATTYSLTSSANGRTLWAVSPRYGKVAAIDVAAARVRQSFDFGPASSRNVSSSVAALSPDGERLAVSTAGKLWFVGLAQRRAEVQAHVAIALGFSPDGKKLWTLGQKSRITAVRVP
jgi:hypothetical protein